MTDAEKPEMIEPPFKAEDWSETIRCDDCLALYKVVVDNIVFNDYHNYVVFCPACKRQWNLSNLPRAVRDIPYAVWREKYDKQQAKEEIDKKLRRNEWALFAEIAAT